MIGGGDIRGHDDDGVAEVHRAPLAVGQPAVVEDLQEDVEDVGVGLFDLVEEDHRVGPPPHRFGELAALVVADVAGRRADQARDRVLLHVLRHVDADHRLLVVEQELGQRARDLGLSDAGRAEEEERTDGSVGVLEAGAGAAHRGRDRRDRFVLPDDAFGDPVLHLEELVLLALEQPRHRDSGPVARPTRAMSSSPTSSASMVPCFGLVGLERFGCLFELLVRARPAGRSAAGRRVRDRRRARRGLPTSRVSSICSLSSRSRLMSSFLVLPLGLHARRLCSLSSASSFSMPAQPLLGCVLSFSLPAPAARSPAAARAARARRSRSACESISMRSLRRRLVHQVDRLVGQEAVGDVAVRKGRRRHQGRVRDAHAVVDLVPLLEAAQDGDGVLDARLADAAPAGSGARGRRPFRCTCGTRRASWRRSQRSSPRASAGLSMLAGVHGALGGAGADEGVQLVDEEDDLALGLLDLLEHRLEAVLELAAVLGAGDQRAHVEATRCAGP